MEYWLIVATVLVLIGIIGSLVPAVPGPTLSFGALLILYFVKGFEIFPTFSLVVFGFATVILVAMDYFAPIVGARMFGATKSGIAGALVGGLLGLLFFPPLGIFIGPFIGAVTAEILGGKEVKDALRAGTGTFLGSMSMLIFQFIFTVFVAIYFFIKLT
ncbi:DUF456 domain-containing protein [bacterium]|jgi:uncharacterized protein|nr:DUF456 domain-containing protein [bacterium]MBT4250782.1 DUF456 domain-containing protein [bacterium]MBT4598226.1 DUF456 domain-containing protein [bacterium]MBT6753824.1 DUF456 domain-containing protein [bacterium]MBT7037463.1 DUF456 domain-containing protein [bacterium]